MFRASNAREIYIILVILVKQFVTLGNGGHFLSQEKMFFCIASLENIILQYIINNY